MDFKELLKKIKAELAERAAKWAEEDQQAKDPDEPDTKG
jgi:hypothetical protein